ncbi:MAG: thioredoxin domain-containing protein [Lachnospiraceae bacterium]|nr:thioredoxin domain-containing protein [Lachnospiraceae bacterium]
MSNHLVNETSPYLLQHADNQTDWYPWCAEAFEKARKEDKPVFLSIGYSTCHWCHVMAHESFENPVTATLLNNSFISVKVDREERPDIDSVYMAVCQSYTGSGGWPLNIFMTWDKKPFFAGTYFPPYPHYGIPGFNNLLNTVKEQWDNNRDSLLKSAEQITKHLGTQKNSNTQDTADNAEDIASMADRAFNIFSETFDNEAGGFGSAPKFPSAQNILFLILYAVRNSSNTSFSMASRTLLQMRKGGIFDHIGYGFSRYSTDRYFLVPHFEKMLYDNAMLIMAYSAAYSVSKEEIFIDTAVKTAEYILREMVSVSGGFYSAQDADSEGTEGKFYIWSLDEIKKVLGEENGKEFARVFDITADGNFEGMNIPNLLKSGIINNNYTKEITKLYNYRKKRTKLHLDNKHLASWNALMAAAFSMLYRASGIRKYLDAAVKSVQFIEENLYDGKVLHTSFCNGKCSGNGFLDDYVFYTTALIEIYNSTLDKSYLDKACYFCNETVKKFASNANGGYFLIEPGNNELFINPKETYDGAMPCGNSVMAYNFTRLYGITKENKYKELAEKQLSFMMANAKNYPAGYSMSLIAGMIYENPPVHITIVLKNNMDKDNIDENNIDISSIEQEIPFFADIEVVEAGEEYSLLNNKTTYYICKNHTCLPPSNEIL